MDTGESDRDRRGSVTSITGASKRRRDEETEDDGGVYAKIRQDLEEFIFNESNKINKNAAKQILSLFGKLEQENINLRVRVGKLEGQLLERRLETRELVTKKTFAEAIGAPRPKIGKKE